MRPSCRTDGGRDVAERRISTTPGEGRLFTALVALLAFAVRWDLVGGVPGLVGYHGYDDGVYFAAAVSLAHGRLPYRDFLFLHPPGIVVALAPFGALARWIGDPGAFATARVVFLLVGAANAVLVTRTARQWGTAAMTAAGLIYAVSPAAASAEHLTLLEPLGSLTLLAGVALLMRASRRDQMCSLGWVAGVVLGLGATVKIWNVVPIIVVICWHWITSGARAARTLAGGVLAAVATVLLPFAIPAGPMMARYILVDQLGRARTGAGPVLRLEGITGISGDGVLGAELRAALLIVVLAGVLAAGVIAWRHRVARLWVALLGVELGVLLLSPSYFSHYAAYSAAALVLVVAAALSAVPPRSRVPLAVVACLCMGGAGGTTRTPSAPPFPAAQIASHLPAAGCIQSDSPAVLVLVDVLSRNLESGCRVPVDLSGQTYDMGARDSAGRAVPRVKNWRWQRDVLAYLRSGSAVVLARGPGDGFSLSTTREISRLRLVMRSGNIRVMVAEPPACSSAWQDVRRPHAYRPQEATVGCVVTGSAEALELTRRR